jgi:hypothetical protein
MSTHPDAEIALDAFDDGEVAWVRLTPEVIEDLGEQRDLLLDAVEEFDSPAYEAGLQAAAWLRERALDEYGSSVTYLMLLDRRVEAFYAIASAEVLLTGRDRKRLFRRSGRETYEISPRQPASLITWTAKRDGGEDGCGERIMGHALATAWEVAELQGNVALVLDPYDHATAEMWSDFAFLDFRRSADPRGRSEAGARIPRLWTPLHPADEGFE